MSIRILALPNKSGIYMIKNIITGRYYIGSAANLNKRANAHRCGLLNNKHCNKKLQRAFNKYGVSSFIFGVMQYCTIEELIKKEQEAIDLYKPYFNIRLIANLNIGVNLSEVTKRRMSKAHKGQKAHPNSTLAAVAANKNRAGNQSEKTLQALRLGPQSRIGKPVSQQTRDLIKASKIGRFFNKETRKFEYPNLLNQ